MIARPTHLSIVTCLLLMACEPPRSRFAPDVPEPEASTSGCTIHWLGHDNSTWVEAVGVLPDGRFIAAVNGQETPPVIEVFATGGQREATLAAPDTIRQIRKITMDADGQVWVLGAEAVGSAWYELDGFNFHREDASFNPSPFYSPILQRDFGSPWTFEGTIDESSWFLLEPLTLVRQGEDGQVDWSLDLECPFDTPDCFLESFEPIDGGVLALVTAADGRLALQIAHEGAGWVIEHDLTDDQFQSHRLAPARDGASAWLMGRATGAQAAWRRVSLDGALGEIQTLPSPEGCTDLAADRLRFDDGAVLTGTKCDRTYNQMAWIAVLNDDDSVRWERSLKMENTHARHLAWNDAHQFVLSGSSLSVAKRQSFSFVVLTDPDAACLEDFEPAPPPEPDN